MTVQVEFETTIANLYVKVEANVHIPKGEYKDDHEVWAEIEEVYVLSNTSARKHVSIEHHEELASINIENLMVWKGKDNAPVFVTDELEAEALEEYHNGQW